MSCKPCEARRKMIAQAVTQRGVVTGLLTVTPRVIRHMVQPYTPRKK